MAMSCFNEAPIHESGKSVSGSTKTARMTGFNEAPIHESGKCTHLRVVGPAAEGFNEAPIHESGKCLRRIRSSSQLCSASMRPRFMNRGSTVLYTRPQTSAIASMRPRFMNRGSIDCYTNLSGGKQRFNEAPIHESGKSCQTPVIGPPR